MGASTLDELVVLAQQVVKNQATGMLTGSCKHQKEPCLQSKRYAFSALNPDDMCLPCRAYWYASMALSTLETISTSRSD